MTPTEAQRQNTINHRDTIFAMVDASPYDTLEQVMAYWKDKGTDITDEQFGEQVSKVLTMWDNGELYSGTINQMIGTHRDDQAKVECCFLGLMHRPTNR